MHESKQIAKSILWMVLSLCLIWHGAQVQAVETQRLTLEQIFDSNDFKAESLAGLQWLKDGTGFLHLEDANDVNDAQDIVLTDSESGMTSIWLPARQLIPAGQSSALSIESYALSPDKRKVLIYTNAKQVWRQKTRGDYWVLNRDNRQLFQLGRDAAAAQLMFAKFSPDSTCVAYVYQNNIYVQDLTTQRIHSLTQDGSVTLINGTADWVNEEELGIRDGFRWSPDSRSIAYWQFNTQDVADMTLINNTDQRYPRVTTFKYPKAGQTNSICRVGVVRAAGGKTQWIRLPGDPREHYIPALAWQEDSQVLVVQQLNRLQNTHRIFRVRTRHRAFKRLTVSAPQLLFTDTDDAWVDPKVRPHWISAGEQFLWLSERDGWRHIYRVNLASGAATLLSWDRTDIMDILHVDENAQWIYVIASPENPTQRYLYRLPLAGGPLERLTPVDQPGSHSYQTTEKGPWAIHTYSATRQPPRIELIRLRDHQVQQVLETNDALRQHCETLALPQTEFFRVTIPDRAILDGWCIKPPDFDPQKTYPVLFHVYGEPAGQTVLDNWPRTSRLWHHLLAQQGIVVMSLDNRGTPAPRGRHWRKCIYRQVGVLAAEDQAQAVRQILKDRPYLDPQRVGVWGWSGGGSMTLNAMFRYPDLYQVGMAVAFVSDMHYYDTIYQERYMGLPQDNEDGYRDGSPVTFAHQLAGDLLLVYGTGDDNCHYQNCETLINRLVEHNKPFDLLVYPNRRHRIAKGKNTTLHLYSHMTRYLLDRFGLESVDGGQ